ncbi:DUF1295 domain-containing protein [Flexivirga sp. ID2601S]|uniref:DUF1295 domain-containing protein n=2 Tax=Flexivirga aerilata TaxID=1656889 RepID=A0A849AQR0_9MICO|nr:DUF1295 domain-containing protein [Flexivirga aerilata]NNG39112.1 DUF1295 domain-containing protein [Flexivirga aerilata]
MALASAVLVALIQAAAFWWSRRAGRWDVADVVWGPGIAAVALLGLATGHGGVWRRVALAVLVTAWAARLAIHIGRRSRPHDDDPRYVRMTQGRSTLATALRVFGLQGLIQWIVSAPIQVVAVTSDPGGALVVLAVLGVVVAVAGLVIEAVADAQLTNYKQQQPRPPILDTGLWAWSRHPNYFGDACFWVGVYLVACAAWPGVATVLSPAIMVGLLVWGSGARLLEKAMADRPGYAEYRSRTPMFVMRPPAR